MSGGGEDQNHVAVVESPIATAGPCFTRVVYSNSALEPQAPRHRGGGGEIPWGGWGKGGGGGEGRQPCNQYILNIYIYIYLSLSLSLCVCACMYVCLSVCLSVCMYVCMYVRRYVGM